MKLSRIMITTLGVLLLAVGAFAGDKSSLNLTEKLSVQGKELLPGKYTLEWTGNGPNVQLNIIKGKETITVSATVVPSKIVNSADSYGTHQEPNGAKSLEAIYPAGKKFGLEITPTASASN